MIITNLEGCIAPRLGDYFGKQTARTKKKKAFYMINIYVFILFRELLNELTSAKTTLISLV